MSDNTLICEVSAVRCLCNAQILPVKIIFVCSLFSEINTLFPSIRIQHSDIGSYTICSTLFLSAQIFQHKFHLFALPALNMIFCLKIFCLTIDVSIEVLPMKTSDSEKLLCQDTPLSIITELFFGMLKIQKKRMIQTYVHTRK